MAEALSQSGERRGLARALLALAACVMVAAVVVAAWPRGAPAAGGASAGAGSSTPSASPREVDEACAAARVYLRKGEPARAEAILTAIAAKAPGSQDVWLLLAEVCLALGRPDEALGAYESALRIGPESGDLAFAAGVAASMAGDASAAADRFARAEALDPSNPQRPLYLAQAQRKGGMTEQAEAALLRATALDPSLAPAWGGLADLALEAGDLGVAAERITRARRAAPDDPIYRLIEARILRREGKAERAATLLLAMEEDRLLADRALVEEAALCLGDAGHAEEAASLCVRASARRSEDGESAALAAEWLDRAGRRDDAIIFAQAAARMGSEKGKATLERLRGGPAKP